MYSRVLYKVFKETLILEMLEPGALFVSLYKVRYYLIFQISFVLLGEQLI